MIMGILGGMIGPIVAAAAVTAAAKPAPYPWRFMAGIRTEPVALASASAVPENPAMITFVTMTTYASPPRMWPTTAVAKATSR